MLATPALAETILVPASLPPAVAEVCPDCNEVLPCGDPDVQYGKTFQRTAMQGEPARAYLLTRAPTRRDTNPLLGQGTAAEARAALSQRLGAVRLLVIEADWATVRLLQPDGAPDVTVREDQHACFADPARGLGCCLGDGPRSQGCLPKADPPTAIVSFTDGAERLRLRYPVGAYEIRLHRGRGTVYWCHGWDRATLVSK
ncbi:MAG: hypothetical protein RIM84_08985 [Alphaproteobacteria bacterium]